MSGPLDRFDTPQAYFLELRAVQEAMPLDGVERIAAQLALVWRRRGTIYTFGNGGSAALASHWACDFAKGTSDILDRAARLKVVSLVDNVALTSAWSNDLAYEEVFAEQLAGVIGPGDAVIAISGSGNSPNVLRGLETAQQAGASCFGLTGFRGGQMLALCHEAIVVPSDSMQIIEDLHVSLCHAIFLALRRCLRQIQSLPQGRKAATVASS